MGTKQELKEVKSLLLEAIRRLEALLAEEDLAKIKLFDEDSPKTGFFDSGTSYTQIFLPKLVWFTRKISRMIEALPSQRKSNARRPRTQNRERRDVQNPPRKDNSGRSGVQVPPASPKRNRRKGSKNNG